MLIWRPLTDNNYGVFTAAQCVGGLTSVLPWSYNHADGDTDADDADADDDSVTMLRMIALV